MRTNHSFGIHFVLRKNRGKNGKSAIYARVTVDKSRCEIALKQDVDPDVWQTAKGLARPKNDDLKFLNSYLERVRGQLAGHYQEMVIAKQLPTADAIKNKFLGIEEKEHTLCLLMDHHNTQMATILSWGTLKNYFTTTKYIKEFILEEYKRSDIYLSELQYKTICQLEHFLRINKPKNEEENTGIDNNGVMKHLERFRKMIKMAVRIGWMEKDVFDLYKLKFQKVEREYLTKEELQIIEKKEFEIDRLQYVKDLFVFSCYTGLAYIDAMQLTPNNILMGIDGYYWINTTRQKTDNPVKVPLLPQAKEIIDKYQGHIKAMIKGTLFPVISNQKLNSYLKELADVCGIKKHLTFHLARHTFATTVTLSNGVPIETVSKMLGHSKITTTQIYAKVIERKVSEDMEVLRGKLSGSNKAGTTKICREA